MERTLRRVATPLVGFVWAALFCAPSWSLGADARPADPLLRLAPADAGVTVVVEDLRGRVKEFLASPLASKLAALPAVKAWQDSETGRNFRRAQARIATILEAEFHDVRDGLLGEAFLLALRLPPDGRPEDARGLLLTRVPDRALLDRALAALNAAQTKSGELVRVSERKEGGNTVYVRVFRPGSGRNNEFYAHLDGRIFAWSNSEPLILEVLERHSQGTRGLEGRDEFVRVRGRLPSRAVVSAYIDPRFVGRVLNAAPRESKPGDPRIWEVLDRKASAWRYFGAALEWRDGIILHTEEVVDLPKLGPSFARWAARTNHPDPSRLRVPPSALVFATLCLDAEVVFDLLDELVPEDARDRFENLRTVVQGLALGLDLRADVFPHLGPAVTAYVGRPEPGEGAQGLPWAVELEVARSVGGHKTASALENAFRTLLAVRALEAKGSDKLRVESRTTSGANVVTLVPHSPWAFAIADNRFVLARTATTALAVAVRADADNAASQRVERLRAAYFPGVESFAWADLDAIHAFASPRRDAIAARLAARQNRSEAEAARDLDQALALIAVFNAGFFTSVVEPGFSGVHRTLGLVTLSPVP